MSMADVKNIFESKVTQLDSKKVLEPHFELDGINSGL